MFWEKKKEPCTEGAVCAWKYREVLYESKEARDSAERRDKECKARENLARQLKGVFQHRRSYENLQFEDWQIRRALEIITRNIIEDPETLERLVVAVQRIRSE